MRKTVEFNPLAIKEINESASSSRALRNLYELQSTDNPDLEEKIKDSLCRATSEDDTHPSPLDRFRYVDGIAIAGASFVSGKVWELFKDKEALTHELTLMVQADMS